MSCISIVHFQAIIHIFNYLEEKAFKNYMIILTFMMSAIMTSNNVFRIQKCVFETPPIKGLIKECVYISPVFIL